MQPNQHFHITHNYAYGTIIGGGNGEWGRHLYEFLRAVVPSCRYSTRGYTYLKDSRGHAAKRTKIDRLAEALRAAGHTVEIKIDDLQAQVTEEATQS